jgi:hypothetical protein
MRDDKSSEDQEKCKEGCDDVENQSYCLEVIILFPFSHVHHSKSFHP